MPVSKFAFAAVCVAVMSALPHPPPYLHSKFSQAPMWPCPCVLLSSCHCINLSARFSLHILYVQAIDSLALNLQNKWVFGDCLAFASSAIQAQDVNLRAAACTVIVVIAEGCCDACTAKLTDLLQVLNASFALCNNCVSCSCGFDTPDQHDSRCIA